MDTNALVVQRIGFLTLDGALPKLFNYIAGSKWLNSLTQYYQGPPNYTSTQYIANPVTSFYGGVKYDNKGWPGQTCSVDGDCASGLCFSGYCASACTEKKDCDGNGSTAVSCTLNPMGTGKVCACSTDPECSDGANQGMCWKAGGASGYCRHMTIADENAAVQRARTAHGITTTDQIVVLLEPSNYQNPGPWHGTTTTTPYTEFELIPWGLNYGNTPATTVAQSTAGAVMHETVETMTNPKKGTTWIGWASPGDGIGGEAADIVGDSTAPSCTNAGTCTAASQCQPMHKCTYFASNWTDSGNCPHSGGLSYCDDRCTQDGDCNLPGVTLSRYRCDLNRINMTGNPGLCVNLYGDSWNFGYRFAIDNSTTSYGPGGYNSNASANGAGAPVFARATRTDRFFLYNVSGTYHLKQAYNNDPTNNVVGIVDWGTPTGVSLRNDVAVTSHRPGYLDVFATDTTTANVYHAYKTPTGSPVWTNTITPTGCAYAMSNPDVTTPQPDVLILVIRCRNSAGSDRLMVGSTAGGSTGTFTWHDITPSGFTLQSGPAVTSWAPGRIDMVIVGDDGSGYHHLREASTTDLSTFNMGTWWDLEPSIPETPLPAYNGDPDLSSWMQGHLDLTIADINGHTYLIEYDSTRLDTTQLWHRYDLGLPPNLPSGRIMRNNPSVTGMGDFRVLVNAADSTGGVWTWKYLDNEGVGSWLSNEIVTFGDTMHAAYGVDSSTW